MSTKYADHGLYGNNASFTASLSGTTLTVTGSPTGLISPGATVLCDAFGSIFPLVITALGTGTGGAGTYTVDHNSNGTVTSTSMTSVNGYPLAAATWGVAQDGDGSSIGMATPSTAEIVFTGVPSSGVINVLGVPVTVTWATSATNCANLLANAINALTTVAVGPASFTNKSQVRNHIYARGPANGAPANTCQIMTRQGSADHDGLVAITHTLNNVSSAGTINFIGGSGGAWGWLMNSTAVMWSSAIAVDQYGLWAAGFAYTGSVSGGDVVKTRSGKTIVLARNLSRTRTLPSIGSALLPVVFEIDDGTVWPEDGVDPVLLIRQDNNGNLVNHLQATASSFIEFAAKRYTSGQRNLVLRSVLTTVNAAGSSNHIYSGYPVKYINVDFYCPGSYTTYQATFQVLSAANVAAATTLFIGCRWVWPGQGSPYANVSSVFAALWVGCTFEQEAPTAPQLPVFYFATGNGFRFNLIGCDFVGFVSGSSLYSINAGWPDAASVTLQNCDFGNVTNRLGTLSTLSKATSWTLPTVAGASDRGNRDFFMESYQGACEWNSSKGYPTLNATLLGSGNPWVIYAVPTTVAGNLGNTSPFCLPTINKYNTLADGTRTLTVNLLLESTLPWNKADISCLLTYTDPDGNYRVSDSFDGTAGALTPSDAAWTSTSYNGQTWTKLAFSLTADIKGGTDITAVIRLHTPVANNTLGVFVDPEVVVT